MTQVLARSTYTVRLAGHIADFDHRRRWFGVGRSVLALGPLTALIFTPILALVVPVGAANTAQCDGVRAVSILCLGGPENSLEIKRWVLIGVFASVVSGVAPRWTAVPHVWAAFTMSVSLTLPDGGDAIGLIFALLILPLALTDDRRWVWWPPGGKLRPASQGIACAAMWLLRFQLAYIYLDSGITKMGVSDWDNGTAEYYIVRDPDFGAAGLPGKLARWFTSFPLGTLALTWFGVAVEIVIGVLFVVGGHGRRRLALGLDLLFHGGIIVLIGLDSFAITMIGGAIVASTPGAIHAARRSSSKRKEFHDIAIGRDPGELPPQLGEQVLPRSVRARLRSS